ncbi:hypothetical protein EGH25_03475 [Haladaptatus sp. F3-133]|uniref:Uncharacterized protein n=1 Tax=Halorutilus salinus TaxID=2487751 RepID=A0A9Q4C1X8_9EURY|nr:hypothetical protein [Halorutilus salinus]MCX2818412.1 hypothetical protein [Halorutilus salinus]
MTPVEGNVLVVASDRRVVSEFETTLRPIYNVWSATSGKQALDIVDNEVDLVAVSEKTADIPGKEVVRAVKERGIRCKAVSLGHDTDPVFDGYVSTPVTPKAVFETVEEMNEARGSEPGDQKPVTEDYENWETEFEIDADDLNSAFST